MSLEEKDQFWILSKQDIFYTHFYTMYSMRNLKK